MATLQQKRRPSVTIVDPIIPSRERSSNSSSPATRSAPLPQPPPSPLQRSRDGSIILPSAPTHEPEDSMLFHDGASRDRGPSPFQQTGSATTSTSSLSLPSSPSAFHDHPPLSISNQTAEPDACEEEEELEELADEDEQRDDGLRGASTVDGAGLFLPQFDPSSLSHNRSRESQSQADLSFSLLAVELAALKALHSLLSTFLSANSESSPSFASHPEAASTLNHIVGSPSVSAPPTPPSRELLGSLIDAVEHHFRDLLPDRPPQAIIAAPSSLATQQRLDSLSSPVGSDRASFTTQAKQKVSLAKLSALLERLSSILPSNPTPSQALASSDIQLSSTLGALIKSLDQLRTETNQNLAIKLKMAGDDEDSEEEESGKDSDSFSAPSSAGLYGSDVTSPVSPPSVDDAEGIGSPSFRQKQHPGEHSSGLVQASSSSTSLPLSVVTSHESLSRQRRGSFPTTNVSSQFNLVEEQLRDPFADLGTQQQQEPDVFSTLHSLMANLSGRTLPAALESEKSRGKEPKQATEISVSLKEPAESQLVPDSPALSELHGGHKLSSDSANDSGSSDLATQVSYLLSATRELVAARRAVQSPTSRILYGYGISSSSLRSRSAGTSSVSLASQGQSLSGGGLVNGEAPAPEIDAQSTRGDLSGLGKLSRTSSGSGRSDKIGDIATNGILRRDNSNPSLTNVLASGHSPSLRSDLRSSLPPKYEDEDGGVEARSVDTHGSLRSSLIGSQSTTLPAYAGLGIASSEKGEKNEKERDRNSTSGSVRSPNGSTAAIQTPQGILKNPLPSGSTYSDERGTNLEKARARSLSGRSEYAARTSADLSLVQSSIERLYSAVPQLADQRVAPSAKLTSVINKNSTQATTDGTQQTSPSPMIDINIEDLVMRMGKRGRMEDQRADLSLKVKSPSRSSSGNNASGPSFRAQDDETLHSYSASRERSASGSNHQSRFPVGSLSGFGSLRKIGGKGKAKEEPQSTSDLNHQRILGDEIVYINSSQSSKFSSPQVSPSVDQNFDDAKRPGRRKSKLEKMGLSPDSRDEPPDLDDPFFDLLASSSSRMSDQEVVLKPGSKLRSANSGGTALKPSTSPA